MLTLTLNVPLHERANEARDNMSTSTIVEAAKASVLVKVYEEVELSAMDYHDGGLWTYQCPCGDVFEITLEEMLEGEDIAHCPSCSLKIRVLYEPKELPSK